MEQDLEKILFYEATKRQVGNMRAQGEILDLFNKLDEPSREKYGRLTHEMHRIWNYINGPDYPGREKKKANSLLEYHESIDPVSPEILSLTSLGITLKQEVSDELKKAFKEITGKDWPE